MSDVSGEIAVEIAQRLTHHGYRDGGTMCLLIGDKGSGKTTGLLNLAEGVRYKDEEGGGWRRETVIWRARSIDYWTRVDPGRRTVWVCAADDGRIRWSADGVRELLPPVRFYTTVQDLIDQIQERPGKIHVVYSPNGIYDFDPRFQDEMGMGRKDIIKAVYKRELDIESIFWYEMMFVLTRHTSRRFFCSLIMDELQRLLPPSTRGLRYHIQAFMALEILPDFRKQNKSLFAAGHATSNMDYRLYPLIQVYGYMRGGKVKKGSSVRNNALALQEPGIVMWDAGLFGRMKFRAYPNLPLVICDRDQVKFPKILLDAGGVAGSGRVYLGDVEIPVSEEAA